MPNRPEVVPTRVGVYRLQLVSARPGVVPTRWGCTASDAETPSRPHACGGVPNITFRLILAATSSPRVWGCTVLRQLDPHRSRSSPRVWGCTAYSGYVELFHEMCPHACRGEPGFGRWRWLSQVVPTRWGCTAARAKLKSRLGVVPTRVGVYRLRAKPDATEASRPHACGGVDELRAPDWPRQVVPTRVGVYRAVRPAAGHRRVAHACGGVPHVFAKMPSVSKSSPHVWGCTERH